MEREEIAERVQSIVKVKDGDLARLRSRLNKFMTCLWHIEWWGQFRDLCEGRTKFALKVRSSFLEDNETGQAGTKIPRRQMSELKEYLRQYGY